MNLLNLADDFRISNPNQKAFSRLLASSCAATRIDFILKSKSLLNSISTAAICPSVYSDHQIVVFTLKYFDVTKGPGFWKFDNSLLLDDFLFLWLEM